MNELQKFHTKRNWAHKQVKCLHAMIRQLVSSQVISQREKFLLNDLGEEVKKFSEDFFTIDARELALAESEESNGI